MRRKSYGLIQILRLFKHSCITNFKTLNKRKHGLPLSLRDRCFLYKWRRKSKSWTSNELWPI